MFRYRSYIYDADLGLYYLQSRYYDPQTGRFINGDDAAYLGANETALSYNPFIYCESDPVNRTDFDGYSSSKKATTLYVSDLDVYNKQTVQDVRNTFAPDFINFMRFRVKNAKEFQYAWEDSKRSEIVVIDTHANYDKLTTNDGPDNGISLFRGTHLTAPKFNLMARIVILLGCNAGHYDHRYENIAYYIAQKLPYGIVVASDGTVSSSMKPNQRVHYDSIVDDNWKKQRKVMYYTQLGMYQSGYIRPKNKGWLIYKRTWAEPFETGIYKFHMCELFAYLAHRKFYNGWAKFWKDQTAYN